MRKAAWILLIATLAMTSYLGVFAQSSKISIDKAELAELAKQAEQGNFCCNMLNHTAVQVQVQKDSTAVIRKQFIKASRDATIYKHIAIVLAALVIGLGVSVYKKFKT
jgi:hypothetical protein